jgi:hypothetical protein
MLLLLLQCNAMQRFAAAAFRPEYAPQRECNHTEAVQGVRTANAVKICTTVAAYKKSAKVQVTPASTA